ncbi:8KDa protein [Beet soil-borne mosaic virus]|uniref:8kDa protein n=1 Tax=Beet soil-borne mosaic virus TaxID=76343 RepID=O72593_9VIRU|nr:8KDa protein [Beet soil-borne mosaic virus]
MCLLLLVFVLLLSLYCWLSCNKNIRRTLVAITGFQLFRTVESIGMGLGLRTLIVIIIVLMAVEVLNLV